jgi:thiol-disulfide isomerase/thioredoxin
VHTEKKWRVLFLVGISIFLILLSLHRNRRRCDQVAQEPWVENRSIEAGAPAPAFELHRHDSEKLVSLSDFEGEVVMLNFWGAWCGWCNRELPHLVKFARTWSDSDLVVVGILNHKYAADTAATDSLIGAYRIPFENLTGIDSVFSKYDIQGYPTTVVLDRNGVVRESLVGYTEYEEFAAAAHRAMEPIADARGANEPLSTAVADQP